MECQFKVKLIGCVQCRDYHSYISICIELYCMRIIYLPIEGTKWECRTQTIELFSYLVRVFKLLIHFWFTSILHRHFSLSPIFILVHSIVVIMPRRKVKTATASNLPSNTLHGYQIHPKWSKALRGHLPNAKCQSFLRWNLLRWWWWSKSNGSRYIVILIEV